MNAQKKKLTLREIVIYAMLGALMFLSKLLLEWAPNIHLLAAFTVAFTVVYRSKALFPIGVFLLLSGVYSGFSPWFVPYLYIWPLLWGVAMLLPGKAAGVASAAAYMGLCALHGLLFGTLYAPFQALFYGMSFRAMLTWIAAGLPYDLIHAAGNLAAGTLVLPLVRLLRRLSA